MKEFEELKLLVSTLTKKEKNSIIYYMKLKDNPDNNNLSIRLFKDVCNNHLLFFEDEHNVLYPNTNPLSFKKLIVRLNEKIIDSFINKEFIISNEKYDLRAKEVFMLERQLLISEVMRYRGLFILSIQKINKVISQCLKYEHYDILVFALEKKRRWQFHELSAEESLKIQKQTDKFNEMKLSVKIAYEAYFFIIKIDKKVATSKDLIFIKQTIKKLEKINKSNPTKHLLFYLYFIKFQLYNIQFKYNKCVEIFEELIVFLNKNESVYTKLRLGSALLNKGVYLRYIFNFELSIQNILESKKYLFEIPQNKDLVYEQLFISYYFNGNLSKAKYYLILINEFNNELIKENKINIILYYRSILEFCLNNFKKSIEYLNKIRRRIENTELSFHIRILEIVNYLEMEKYDIAEYYIDNFIKYNERVGKNLNNDNIFGQRIRILKKLCNSNLNFNLTELACMKDFLQLEKLYPQFSFEYNDMFNFKYWFECKKQGRLYDHSSLMHRF